MATKKSAKAAAQPSAPAARPVVVRSVPIELCQLLKFAGLSESGGQAKQLITEGGVTLNGTVETQKGKKLAAGDIVQVGEERIVVTLA
jgi:ribosome-associated protein